MRERSIVHCVLKCDFFRGKIVSAIKCWEIVHLSKLHSGYTHQRRSLVFDWQLAKIQIGHKQLFKKMFLGSSLNFLFELLHIQLAVTCRAWTCAVMSGGSCQELNFSNCVPGIDSFANMEHCWRAITQVSWCTLPLSVLCLNPRCCNNANWQQLTQMVSRNTDRQRKRTTHRSKKTGRLYTHCPWEDIVWQFYQLIWFKLFAFFFFLL